MPYDPDPSGPYDLTLTLMHLPDGATLKVSRLLSPDYPANFERQAEAINRSLAQTDPAYEVSASGLREMFGSLCAVDWSPSGRYLAFAGEMDGPSWDLYVYDMLSHAIRRLSSGMENVVGMSWSPDEKRILHWSAFDACEGGCERWWIASADGTDVRELNVPGNSSLGWASNILYRVYTGANGPGRENIIDVNVVTNQVTPVWPHQFDDFVVDHTTGIVGVGVEDWEESLPAGFYLYDAATRHQQRILEGGLWTVSLWANGDFSFIATSDEVGTVGVRSDGTYQTLSGSPKWDYVSPDNRWVAFRSAHTEPGIELLTPQLETLVVSSDTARGITWRPDSVGFYYLTESQLYYVPVQDPHPVLVDIDVPDPYDSFPVWLP